ncbi:RNA polymerase factor sigma-54 [Blattabacterium cuenoti]|uniref:RNA polymerase sigma-54 factor n=1 Tax=Blattabacterium cuenoti STAT TaxID=1457030 RepID=A0A224AKU8_9FLAO|nr:RNA polymerase factor sigma-54 [Blattabacterium cuenoti]BBA17428.1 RNA polymerase sigma-54 factor [Blattabacterium cuenoti STAT]
MLKQQLSQKSQHKLSPQQIRLMKLVQLSTLDFEQKVQQELEENPALEEENCSDLEEYSEVLEENKTDITEDKTQSSDIYDIDNEYFSDDEIEDFQINNPKNYSSKKYIPIISEISFQEYLKNQLHTFFLNKKDLLIADFILGNIDDDGYIRRKILSIADDIFLILGKTVSPEKIEKLLVNYIQKLDPIGVGSRNLQECLLIQLNKKKINKEVFLSKKIIRDYFDSFVKKHYKKLQKKLGITKKNLRKVLDQIKKLNPKPGKIYSDNTKNLNHIIPDFDIYVSDEKLELTLNQKNIPEIKISSLYLDMLKSYQSEKNVKKNEETIVFLKKKIDSAKWFVDAIKQRQNTLMLTMNAIMDYQKEYFLTGDPVKIKPMILKNISQKIGVGISTVSRVANSKYVNTPYGTFLIKSFFSEKMINQKGKEISSIEIKKLLKESIDKENKKKPFTDEKLSKILKKKGYLIARRTIAKYRNQMHFPVARMRKNL